MKPMKRLDFFRKTSLLVAIAAMVSLGSCGDKSTDEPVPEPTPDPIQEIPVPDPGTVETPRAVIDLSAREAELAKAINRFSFDLFKNLYDDAYVFYYGTPAYKPNTLVSPMGFVEYFGLLANATGGETRSKILNAVAGEGCTIDEYNTLISKLRKAFPVLDAEISMSSINSVWVRGKDAEFLVPSFSERVSEFYDAPTTVLPLFDNSAVKAINDWCDKNTNGLIPMIFPSNKERIDLRFVATNALCFKGPWQMKFDKDRTTKADFHNFDGTVTSVDMMENEEEYFSMYFHEHFQALSIPYGHGSYCMMILRPNKNVTFKDFLDSVVKDADNIADYLREPDKDNDCKKLFRLPKFDLDDKLQNIDFSRLGLEGIFDVENADYSNMFSKLVPDEEIREASVVQLTKLIVDETGSEASAITSTDEAEGTFDPNFIIDRPFMIVIAETSTGLPLFIGRIEKL